MLPTISSNPPKKVGYSEAPFYATFSYHLPAVCHIVIDPDTTKKDAGTGFLIGSNLILTNHHVIPDEDTAKISSAFFLYTPAGRSGEGALGPTFEAKLCPSRFFHSSPSPDIKGEIPLTKDLLDFTIVAIVAVKEPEQLDKINRRAFSILNPLEPVPKSIIYIPQHPVDLEKREKPRGDREEYRGVIHQVDAFAIHHFTRSEGGASGAPILNADGRLIGLHRGKCLESHVFPEGPSSHPPCKMGVRLDQIIQYLKDTSKIGELTKYLEDNPIESAEETILNLPKPPKNFTGREKELEALTILCQQNERVILSGLGGVGKTATVLKYAEDHKNNYSFTHLISGATIDLIIEGLLNLANHCKIPEGEHRERLEMLKFHLNKKQVKPFLLIFDGVDSPDCLKQLDHLLPNQGKCLLVTSCLSNPNEDLGFAHLPLTPFTKEEAVSYLIKETGDLDEAQAALLAEELGYLPLALKHAAAYIKKNGRIPTFKAYLELFRKEGLKMHDPKYLRLPKQEKTILTTWKISLDAISKECESAIKMAHFLSCMPHAPIPMVVIETWFKASIEDSELEFQAALGYLEEYSLLDTTEFICEVHALVQKVIKSNLSEEDSQKNLIASLETFAKLKQIDLDHPKIHNFLSACLPHFIEIFSYFKDKDLSEKHQEALIDVLELSYLFFESIGSYLDCKNVSCYHLELTEKRYGQDSIQLANSLSLLGIAFEQLGEYSEAFGCHHASLKLNKKILGKENVHFANNLTHIGILYQSIGRLDEARKKFEKALVIFQKLNDQDDVAKTLSGLGVILKNERRYPEALDYQEKALKIFRETSGNENINVAKVLDSIGVVLKHLGRHEDALKKCTEALDIFKGLYGRKHFLIAESLGSIGSILLAQGKHQEGLEKEKESLTMLEDLLGNNHVKIAIACYNIGYTLQTMNEWGAALNYLKRAVKITESFDTENPGLSIKLYHSISECLKKLGDEAGAMNYRFKMLKIRALQYGVPASFLTEFENFQALSPLSSILSILASDSSSSTPPEEKSG